MRMRKWLTALAAAPLLPVGALLLAAAILLLLGACALRLEAGLPGVVAGPAIERPLPELRSYESCLSTPARIQCSVRRERP